MAGNTRAGLCAEHGVPVVCTQSLRGSTRRLQPDAGATSHVVRHQRSATTLPGRHETRTTSMERKDRRSAHKES